MRDREATESRPPTGGGASGTSGPTVYTPLANPSLLGGPDGREVGVAGDVAEARGQTVELPDSPLALGAVRPYETVYPDYAASAGQALARLYATVRLFVNFFQPSFKLAEKHREGSRIIKRYLQPATPAARLID